MSGEIPRLPAGIEVGQVTSADTLLSLVYAELRKLAAAKLAREPAQYTLQPTALVHEAWLRLGGESQPQWKDRAHFFGAAAEAMRRILIDNARRRAAQCHGGGLERVNASEEGFEIPATERDDKELLLLNEAMDNLTTHDPRKAELVKQWYFAGLKVEEVAEVLGISVRTAMRDWAYSRAWLVQEMDRLRR
jgi:RNA polymerase sigma factor (TIGR02999 family)